MNRKEIKNFLENNNQPKFRWVQIKKAIFEDGILSFDKISTIPKDLREDLTKNFKILSLETVNVPVSKDRKVAKALLKTSDGRKIETVLIASRKGEWSACVSSQAGCPLGCKFCATGNLGFGRNLSAEEITDQILFWRGFLAQGKLEGKLSNIIFMGMGEPFLNWENVRESLKDLTDENLFGFGDRSISVSTAGIPDGIKKISHEFPQVNLAVSLHTANDKKRDDLMPINKKYDLAQLKRAIVNYLDRTNRKVFIEYVMLDGINDSRTDAKELVDYIKSFEKKHLLHVNLISYNITSGQYQSTPQDKIMEFKGFLARNDVHVTVRKSLGDEIKGACGQLAGK